MSYRLFHRAASQQDLAARSAVLTAALWSWLIGWLFASIFPPHADGGALATSQWLVGPVAWGALLLGWRGHWRWAALWWAAMMGGITIVYCWRTQGMAPSSVMNLAVISVFAWWALGRRYALAALAVSALLLVALGLRGNFDWPLVLYGGVMLLFWAVAVVKAPSPAEFGASPVAEAPPPATHVQEVAVAPLEALPSAAVDMPQTAQGGAHANAAPVAELVSPLGADDGTAPDPAIGALMEAAVRQSPESLLIVNLQGRVVYANAAFLRQSGYRLEEVVGQQSVEVSATGMTQSERKLMRQMVGRGGAWRGVLSNRRKDGSAMTQSICISALVDAQGQQTHFMELKQDITELLAAQQRITQLMNFDTLTMLPNRHALLHRLQEQLAQAALTPVAQQRWHGLLLMDMDRFSKFNAARGIEWGDALLRAVAHKLGTLLPPNAWVARTTGDEFAVVLDRAGINRLDARMAVYSLANTLQSELALQVVEHGVNTENVQVSFAIGFTVFPFIEAHRSSDSVDHILRRASLSLHQAKAKGPGETYAFSEALVESSERKVAVEKGLYEALAQNHLRMYVQPQVDLHGQTVGLEALIRWKDPLNGMISPGIFIPVAEESELIVLLGDWMLSQACDFLAHPLVRKGSYGVSVNVSSKQFTHPDFVEKVAQLMKERGIPTGRLTLEITESLVLSDVEEVIHKLATLQALGLQFAIDDFGTGYSSLSYLRRLPIQEIKIDQSFIQDLEPDSGGSGTLVQALLMLAKHMNLRVVAEGVETEAQATLLQALEPGILCQGYFYSQPIAVQEWLDQLGPKEAEE